MKSQAQGKNHREDIKEVDECGGRNKESAQSADKNVCEFRLAGEVKQQQQINGAVSI